MEYSYLNFFRKVYRETGQEFSFCAKDTDAFFAWRKKLRSALWDCLGFHVLERFAGQLSEKEKRVVQKGRVQEDGYCRYDYEMQTLPEVWMPFFVLVPNGVDGQHPTPAMLTIPAHNANRNIVCGVAATIEEEKKLADAPLECYGKEYAKQGYLVFCPELPGFGERIEPVTGKKSSLICSCSDLSEIAEALGFSLAALEVWDLMRLLDYACTRPEVARQAADPAESVLKENRKRLRIGCTGFSGGGLQTMWLAALDDRVQLAVISGYVHSYYDSILKCHRCACNFVPNLWKLCDISDICSLIAPRPLYMENGISDSQNGWDGIEGPIRQVEKIRSAYALFDARDRVVHYTPEGIHRWYAGCYGFVKENL